MTAPTAWQTLVFIILPYVALTVFVVGHVWRYRFDRFGWTSRSSQLYERRSLLVGGPLFHYGALLAILGHAVGLLVPETWTTAVGVPEHLYADFARVAGTAAATLIIVGLAILTARRLANDRVRAVTSVLDWVALALLWVVVVLGTWVTVGHNVLGPGYDYRTSVSLWLRGIASFHPMVHDIAAAPLIFQVHATAGLLFLAVFPFTRFVHFWSAPVWYLARPFVVYRRRREQATAAAQGARAWRTLGRTPEGPRP